MSRCDTLHGTHGQKRQRHPSWCAPCFLMFLLAWQRGLVKEHVNNIWLSFEQLKGYPCGHVLWLLWSILVRHPWQLEISLRSPSLVMLSIYSKQSRHREYSIFGLSCCPCFKWLQPASWKQLPDRVTNNFAGARSRPRSRLTSSTSKS